MPEERTVVHAALTPLAAEILERIIPLYTELVALRRHFMPGRTMSKATWQQTPEGLEVVRRAINAAPKVGYAKAQHDITQEYLKYLKERGLRSPTHGEARSSPPPSYVLGDLVERALALAASRIETETRAELQELNGKRRRHGIRAA
jgi:hypothetical protein